MNPWLASAASATTVLSAIALYAGSRHGRWPMRAHRARTVSAGGLMLAVLSLTTWVQLAGVGVGFCTMLGGWMLTLMVLPCLALRGLTRQPPAPERGDVG